MLVAIKESRRAGWHGVRKGRHPKESGKPTHGPLRLGIERDLLFTERGTRGEFILNLSHLHPEALLFVQKRALITRLERNPGEPRGSSVGFLTEIRTGQYDARPNARLERHFLRPSGKAARSCEFD